MLFDDTPIIFSPTLALVVGDRAAMMLQELHRALQTDEAVSDHQDGKVWVRRSAKDLSLSFPFWHENTIRNIISRLEETGYLFSATGLGDNPLDQAKWYSIDYSSLFTAISLAKSKMRAVNTRLEELRLKERQRTAAIFKTRIDQDTKRAMLRWSIDLFLRLSSLNESDMGKDYPKIQKLWYGPMKEIMSSCYFNPEVVELVIRESLRRSSGLTIKTPSTILSAARSIISEIKRGDYSPSDLKGEWTQL